MNNDQFVSGGMTDENLLLYVTLFDENGINTVGNSIGHDLEATLTFPDGHQETFIVNDFYESSLDDYQTGIIQYPLKNLPEGNYNMSLRAWDTYNNPGYGQTEFIVQPSANLGLQHVLNYPNPFTTSTLFQFEHNYPNQALSIQIQIYTVSGRLVKTIDKSLYPEENTGFRVDNIAWDGRDEFGERLAKGVYLYKVFVQVEGTDLDSEMSSAFQKLVKLK